MIKETFEKEPYTAPQWGLRVVCVERHYLTNGSDTSDDDYGENDMGEV